MKVELSTKYLKKLDKLGQKIQESEELVKYLENEEEEDYNAMKKVYEPRIAALYAEVALHNPLELVAFEEQLMDPKFEGLYLPKALGFSVLRGEGTPDEKYQHPQEHFKNMLLAVCNSANFDILKKRMGQTVQVGFAYSSDIWVTNLINGMTNKRVRYYLQGHRRDIYRDKEQRKIGLLRYKKQFVNENYQSAEFPNTLGGLKVLFSDVKNFLLYRVQRDFPNESVVPFVRNFLDNGEFKDSVEHLQIMAIYAMFFDIADDDYTHLKGVFNASRQSMTEFDEHWLEFILEMYAHDRVRMLPSADQKMVALLDAGVKDQLTEYYALTEQIDMVGYKEKEAMQSVKDFYIGHEGVSIINECVRKNIFYRLSRHLGGLSADDYSMFFEITKTFKAYMDIFLNQKFNQSLKDISMKYIRTLLKVYTDKRGKDYQDIKKFVSVTFLDFNFLTEKEIVNLFKTKRKRRKKPADA